MTDQDADAPDGKEPSEEATAAKEPSEEIPAATELDEDPLDGKELEELQSQIDDLKSRVERHTSEQDDEGERFVDQGEVREEEVDDTIAPPG